MYVQEITQNLNLASTCFKNPTNQMMLKPRSWKKLNIFIFIVNGTTYSYILNHLGLQL